MLGDIYCSRWSCRSLSSFYIDKRRAALSPLKSMCQPRSLLQMILSSIFLASAYWPHAYMLRAAHLMSQVLPPAYHSGTSLMLTPLSCCQSWVSLRFGHAYIINRCTSWPCSMYFTFPIIFWGVVHTVGLFRYAHQFTCRFFFRAIGRIIFGLLHHHHAGCIVSHSARILLFIELRMYNASY